METKQHDDGDDDTSMSRKLGTRRQAAPPVKPGKDDCPPGMAKVKAARRQASAAKVNGKGLRPGGKQAARPAKMGRR
jgi:hypothetical protein